MGAIAGLDRVRLPAAVSPLVAAELAGPPRHRRVLAAFPSCLYVELGAHERVLGVLTSDAEPLPIGVRLAVPSSDVQWGVEPGGHVVVGEGRVRLPQADVVAVRPLPPGRVQPVRSCISAVSLPAPGALGALARDLTAAALAAESVEAGVRGLVGAGRGLTPSGDDVLCGVLLTLSAVESPEARRALAAVRTVVRSALLRTTSLSAALLVAAGDGYAVPDVARLVTLLAGAGCAAPERGLVERVLAIGHTSGRDLLAGVSGALRALRHHASTTQEGVRRA
ncbi:hypothetical protein GCM10009740_08330 [Terrabacter terrae]|uniref:DUF2877 domain-containing protein n=1 Tax=Terrabacter terrae TaxID=318434 RepID=A0ABN2TUL3_9MICO